MKRMFATITIAFLLATTPATASRGKEPDKDNPPESPKPSATCDPSLNWKNHGEYLSCVARLHEGGKNTSEAARSDIGKREDSPKPSASVSPAPSASPSPNPSSSPSASPSTVVSESVNIELQALIQTLQNILTSLQKLIVR